MNRLLLIILTLVLLGTVAPLKAESLKITELVVTTKISKRNPIDAVHRISHRSVKTLYCFTRIQQQDDATDSGIKHVWLRDGQVVKEVELPVKGWRWRAYSAMSVNASSRGDWRVEVRDPAGAIIKAVAFKVH